MEHKTVIVAFVAVAALTVSCNKDQTPSQRLDELQSETKEAAKDIQEYTYAQKSAFVETMRAHLAALTRDLDPLAAKVEASSDAVKAEAKPKLQALRHQTTQLSQQLDDVKNATESTWDGVKNAFKQGYEASNHGFNQARQWVSAKLAPRDG